ncbi:MAG: DNA repair protein RecN [Actinobacteria bacterium]|nr:DNA repair protein RecN [Actinomycetota bacterium]
MSEFSRLEEISIRGIGVIDEASIELGSGLTVFTGETGAGKTMILTALALVLGGKAEATLVRQGKERLIASATFAVTPEIAENVIERGGSIENNQLILSRTVTSDGKSKASAGGISVPTGVLASLSESLIEIHGQAANMSITKPAKQREILDRFGGSRIADALAEFTKFYDVFLSSKKKLNSLKENSAGREKQINNLVEFSEAFKKVNPIGGELDDLAQEISRLSSVEALQLAAAEAARLLDDESTGALTTAGQAKRALESVQTRDGQIRAIVDTFTEGYFLLSDAAEQVHRYLTDLEMDPERLELALSRKAEVTKFLKRFSEGLNSNAEIEELKARFEVVEEEIADLSGGEERIVAMVAEVKLNWEVACEKARILSELRSFFAEELSSQVTTEIQGLAMPHTRMICQLSSPDYGREISQSELSAFGGDEVSMLLQPHKDGPLVALAKGASGGEMSRVMLGLEVVLASSQPVGTYIFDEVDAGVGGKAAIDVGKRLYELSRHAQVIVVTHLPQVAAWADAHFVLHKNSDGTVSQSDVRQVQDEARIEEIARMLAGHEDSRSAREHATELLSMRSGK